MLKFTQEQRKDVAYTSPINFLCPSCNRQISMLHVNAIMCYRCLHVFKIKYFDLCKDIKYRINYHLNL